MTFASRPLLPIIFALCFCILGCAPRFIATVTDSSGQRRELGAVTTDKGGVIEVLDGPALRHINLKNIQTVLIKNTSTASHNGELYYAAELWLTDSTKILSYLLPNGKRTEAYVNVSRTLIGKTAAGRYEIPFKDVRQIRFSKVK